MRIQQSRSSLVLGLAVLVLGSLGSGAFAMGCISDPTGSDDEPVGSDHEALTEEQCEYFDVNGSVQICHATGSTKNPYKILRISDQGCINGHAGHAGDYVTSTNPSSPLYDPTCQGLGCLPEDAPCDATVPCCDGSTCEDGTCVAEEPAVCPCAADPSWVLPLVEADGCLINPGPPNVLRLFYHASANEIGVYGDECASAQGYIAVTPAERQACITSLKAVDAANGNFCAACDACPSGCSNTPYGFECF